MFDRRKLLKSNKLTIAIILLAVVLTLIPIAYSKLFSKTDSDSKIETALYILNTDYYEKEVKLDELSSKIGEILELIQQNMFDTCKKRMEAKTTIAHNLEEFQANMNKEQGFIKAMWCGNEECEAKIKELTAAKSRCMPFEQEHIGDTCVCCGKPATKMVIWGRQY